jgi:hypothetical protein
MRDVVLGIKDQLATNADPVPVVSYVNPGQTGDYIWLDESSITTQGPAKEGNEATFQIAYRARGKAACAALAQSGDFIQELTVPANGDAIGIRFKRDSRAGPTEDPDLDGQFQIVDTVTAKFSSRRRLAKGAA